jgi:DNA-directed RNA polymerase subunit RPC12/RpoP
MTSYQYSCQACGEVVLLRGEPMHNDLLRKGKCPTCGHSGCALFDSRYPERTPSFDPWEKCPTCDNKQGLALHILLKHNPEWKGVDRSFRFCDPRYNGCGERFYEDGDE